MDIRRESRSLCGKNYDLLAIETKVEHYVGQFTKGDKMAGSVNKVILIGNVGKDPEVRTFGNGGKVCNLTLATSETWKDKQTGERKEKTDWHNVAIFNEGLVGICERYVKKGSKIYIGGALKTRKWQDRDGNDRYTTEVVLQGYNGALTMLDSRNGGGGGGGGDYGRSSNNDYNQDSGGGYQGGGQRSASAMEGPKQDFDLDDDIPF